MAVTSVANGNYLMTGSYANIMAPYATAGVFVFVCDLGTMANIDVIELTINTITNGGPSRIAYYAVYANLQGQPMKYSVPVPSLGGADTIAVQGRQTAGTLRTIPFRVLAIG